jgi:hypothetical protein
MVKIAKKMPITIILLVFSYLIAVCGIGVGSFWMIFKFKATGYFIYGFLILVGSLLLAALIRMFADIGQMVFDIKADIWNLFGQAKALGQVQHDALIRQAKDSGQVQHDAFIRQAKELKDSGQVQHDAFIRQAKELKDALIQKLTDIKDNFNQMNCDSRDMNQNIQQIRAFFEQIERHLDLKK